MSIKQSPSNRDMASATNKVNKGEDFFFSGGLEYHPISINAQSTEEAHELWLKKRVSVTIKDNK